MYEFFQPLINSTTVPYTMTTYATAIKDYLKTDEDFTNIYTIEDEIDTTSVSSSAVIWIDIAEATQEKIAIVIGSSNISIRYYFDVTASLTSSSNYKSTSSTGHDNFSQNIIFFKTKTNNSFYLSIGGYGNGIICCDNQSTYDNSIIQRAYWIADRTGSTQYYRIPTVATRSMSTRMLSNNHAQGYGAKVFLYSPVIEYGYKFLDFSNFDGGSSTSNLPAQIYDINGDYYLKISANNDLLYKIS